MLNIFNDHDYNRSVITIVAAIDSIGERTAAFVSKMLSYVNFLRLPGGREGGGSCSLQRWGFGPCSLLSDPLRGGEIR